MTNADNIKSKAIESIKWTIVTEVVMRALPPITTLILARLLTPEEFGIIAAVMTIITLIQMFQEFGLGKTLIQREDRINQVASIIFISNLLLGLLFGLLLFFSAGYIGAYFNNNQVADVIRVLWILVLISSFGTVHIGLLQRSFSFKRILVARIAYPFVYAGVTLPLAATGYGVWSLVYGMIGATLVQVIVLWVVDSWRPSLQFDFDLAKEIFNFAKWVFLEMFMGWAIMQGDSLILGRVLGVETLGIYWTGVTILGLIFGVVFNPLQPVAYSAFSRLQSDIPELRKTFLMAVRTIAAISLPMGLGIACIASPFATVVLGNKWAGIEIVLIILGLKEGMSYLVSLNPEIYRAVGRPDMNVRLAAIIIILCIPVYIIAAPYGLFIFCIARFFVVPVSLLFHFYLAHSYLGVPFTYIFHDVRVPFLASVMMVLLIYPLSLLIAPFNGWTGAIKLMTVIMVGLVTYICTVRILDRELLNSIFKLVREAVK